MVDVRSIVTAYLIQVRADGLVSPNECSCMLDDLMPCGVTCDDCEPGRAVPARDGSEDFWLEAMEE